MIRSLTLPEEKTKLIVGKPIIAESNVKVTVINDYREEPEEAFWILYPMGVKCLSMITKSLLNTNRDFVTNCAFQHNILLIMTVILKTSATCFIFKNR
ncbi:hypothetical protein C7M16_01765 [Bacillus subtilis]|nr:hypothetical protein C7M16_01765 [Bacillus subtilis]